VRALFSSLLPPSSPQAQPAARPTAQQLLSSPWVSGAAAPTALLPARTSSRLAQFQAEKQIWRSAVYAAALLTTPAPLGSGGTRAAGSDADVEASIRAAFDAYDKDRNGHIDRQELA
jgi:hypothetical protein